LRDIKVIYVENGSFAKGKSLNVSCFFYLWERLDDFTRNKYTESHPESGYL
jgi:hypothetical protein